jgi:phosphate transport system substrate-binding protein
MRILITFIALLFFAPSNATAQTTRDTIRIVGSSTVFPFSTVVAERFGKNTPYNTPIIESTGTGGGMKLFCSGVGPSHPIDITNASRGIKNSEVELCESNGVTEIKEVMIGFDGIVLANKKSEQRYSLTLREIFLALAKHIPQEGKGFILNPYQRWSEINPELPDTLIEVLGPPPTSGTRDAFVELAMEGGCKTFPVLKELKKKDKSKFKSICHAIREDRRFVMVGENDNLIVQKLDANPDALGIFGFSFLDQNGHVVQGSIINGSEPTFENIADGSYPISRSLFFYVKEQHYDMVPGMEEFVSEFTSERAIGEDGYLTDRGLIPR